MSSAKCLKMKNSATEKGMLCVSVHVCACEPEGGQTARQQGKDSDITRHS